VDRDAVAVAGQHVAVEAVVRDVQLAVVEPLGERRFAPVECAGEGAVPVEELTRLIGPEPEAVRGCPLVEAGIRDRVGGELLAGGETPGFVEEVVDCVAPGESFRSFAMRSKRSWRDTA